MYFSKFLKIFTVRSQLAKLCQFDKATFPSIPPSPKSMLQVNTTATLKREKGGRRKPYGKMSHLIFGPKLSESVYLEKLDIFLDLSFQPSCINFRKGFRFSEQFKKNFAKKL